MQLSHGISSLAVVGRKVTSCLYIGARNAQCFLLVLRRQCVAGFKIVNTSEEKNISF